MIQFMNAYPNMLAYTHVPAEHTQTTILFLPGFRSDMMGTKAQYLQEWCRRQRYGYISLDYSGHGQSDGVFEECTVSQWLLDTITVVKHCSPKQLIIVGSSMGAWLMLMAVEHLQNIKGLVGIASAPDFVGRMLQSLSTDQLEDLKATGSFVFPTPLNPDGWRFSQEFLDDAQSLSILGDDIDINVPVRLIHGCLDTAVGPRISLQLMKKITGDDVHLRYVKDGDHNLNRDGDLAIITRTIEELL